MHYYPIVVPGVHTGADFVSQRSAIWSSSLARGSVHVVRT